MDVLLPGGMCSFLMHNDNVKATNFIINSELVLLAFFTILVKKTPASNNKFRYPNQVSMLNIRIEGVSLEAYLFAKYVVDLVHACTNLGGTIGDLFFFFFLSV